MIRREFEQGISIIGRVSMDTSKVTYFSSSVTWKPPLSVTDIDYFPNSLSSLNSPHSGCDLYCQPTPYKDPIDNACSSMRTE